MTQTLNPLPTSIIPAQWQALIEENRELRAEVKRLKELNSSLVERVAAQSEILSRVARRR